MSLFSILDEFNCISSNFTCFQLIQIREKVKRFAYLPTVNIFGMLAETQFILTPYLYTVLIYLFWFRGRDFV